MTDLRDRLDGLGDVKLSRPSLFSVATPVEVVLFGQDLDQLRTVGDAVAARLSGVSGLADVRSSLLDGPSILRPGGTAAGADPGADGSIGTEVHIHPLAHDSTEDPAP